MRRIILLLTVALVMAAMMVAMAMPAMAFTTTQHCQLRNQPEPQCPFPEDERAPIISGAPGQTQSVDQAEGAGPGTPEAKNTPGAQAVHCGELGGSGTTVGHFDGQEAKPTKVTGGGDCFR